MKKRVLVVDGHPDGQSLCAALAMAYAQGARNAGADVELLVLRNLQFDPILHHGYRVPTPLEPALQQAQAFITWAQHLVIVAPVWWGRYPALLQGFLDRVLLPGFAYKYATARSLFPRRLLHGRSARVILTMDAPAWWFRWAYGVRVHRALTHATLRYCGIRPVHTTLFTSVKFRTPGQRQRWLKKVNKLGEQVR
jgi:putative NADPH-quinone reductase